MWAHHHRTLEALGLLTRAVRRGGRGPASEFRGLSSEEAEARLREVRREHDNRTVLFLVAGVEAVLQLDARARLARRVKSKGKPAHLRAELAARRDASANNRLELEQILDAWKAAVGRITQQVSFRQVLQYRHWLAHGRYWVQKSGIWRNGPDPDDAWARSTELLTALHSELPLSAW